MSPEDHGLNETLERLRTCASLSHGRVRNRWLDLLGVSRRDYDEISRGRKALPETAVSALSSHFGVTPESILEGTVDFRAIAVRYGAGERDLPPDYAVAAFGRRRTTITSFDFLEEKHGWRARALTLRAFGVNEAILSDPMARINMQFMTDAAQFMHLQLGLRSADFFGMGAYSPVGNRKTVIAETFGRTRTASEAYELMLEELIKFFELNTEYVIQRLDEEGCTIDVSSYRYVAEALGVRHLGNTHICALKAGFLAAIPLYLDLPLAAVAEPLCVHRGDAVCRYVVAFPTAQAALRPAPRSGTA